MHTCFRLTTTRNRARTRLALLALATASALLLLSGCAGDSRARDVEKSGIDEPLDLPRFTERVELNRLWSADVGQVAKRRIARMSPAVVDGRVYALGRKGRISVFDANSGDRLYSTRLEEIERFGAGPGVYGDLLVVGSLEGQVYGLAAADGSVRWQAQVSSEVAAPPVVTAGVVIVRTSDGWVYGFNRSNGERLYAVDRAPPLLTLRGIAPIAISGDLALIGHDDGRISALAVLDGSVRWEQSVSEGEGRTELERLADVDGVLAVTETDVVAASFGNRLTAMTLDSGAQVWSADVASYAGVAADQQGVYVVDAQSAVIALDRRSGAELWRNEELKFRDLTPPLVIGQWLLVGDVDGQVLALDKANGQLSGRLKIGGDGFSAGLVSDGNRVYAQTRSGRLVAIAIGG